MVGAGAAIFRGTEGRAARWWCGLRRRSGVDCRRAVRGRESGAGRRDFGREEMGCGEGRRGRRGINHLWCEHIGKQGRELPLLHDGVRRR
uniref:Uncharacterized protein n=1 Tax=Oryza glumipatula TaxID=40148 RepID=A0A0E0AGH7_9ORYZ